MYGNCCERTVFVENLCRTIYCYYNRDTISSVLFDLNIGVRIFKYETVLKHTRYRHSNRDVGPVLIFKDFKPKFAFGNILKKPCLIVRYIYHRTFLCNLVDRLCLRSMYLAA